jgi:hypothetical protein
MDAAMDPQTSTNGTLEHQAQSDVEMKDEPTIDVRFLQTLCVAALELLLTLYSRPQLLPYR